MTTTDLPPDTDEPGLAIVPPDEMPRDGDEPATGSLLREAARTTHQTDKFPVVALGGSAGSLVAFEQFFTNMPSDSGMAFIVISHLVPDHVSELAQVLQHFTAMPVREATDGLRVRPDHVYVIPPNRDMSILHGTLLLFAPTQPPGRRLPIDFFFQSLAKDAR